MIPRQTILVEWVFYSATGHAIEGYKFAHALRGGNPSAEIWLLLNAQCPGVQLAPCFEGADRVLPVSLGDLEGAFRELPAEWDYVLHSSRSLFASAHPGLPRFWKELRSRVASRIATAVCNAEGIPITGLAQLPRFEPGPLRLHLPKAARRFAKEFIGDRSVPRVSVLLGSASEGRTPPIGFWKALFRALTRSIPNVEIVLFGTLDQRTSFTLGVTQADVDELVQGFPNVRNTFDIGLMKQAAVAERCQCLISPHTGMGFVLQCAGLPWVILSGAEWPVRVFNGVPFVSIDPDCEWYPCSLGGKLADCLQRQQNLRCMLCMTEEALAPKIGRIVDATRALLAQEIPYTECIERYCDHLSARRGALGSCPQNRLLMDWPAVMGEQYVFRR